VRQWLREAGIDYPLITGGYKAMRQFLLAELERSAAQADVILIAGKTGTGKTRVIEQLPRSVDLEGLALHRGSSFGQLLEPQPRQIDFENSLSIGLMKLLAASEQRVYLEDEGHLIGRIYVPDVLQASMKQASMLVVEESLEQRIDVVIADYVTDLGARFAHKHGEQGAQMHSEKLQQDLARIRKRLGGERFETISGQMSRAFTEQASSGSLELHRHWVEALLAKYYDPMYDYQLSQRSGQIIFRGSREEVVAWTTETG
jgi:tRNA 2-selenouridine synthase